MVVGRSKLQFVNIVYKVGKAHEAGPFVLTQVRADSARVSACAVVEHDAKLVVGHFVGVTTDRLQELHHVDGQLELSLDDLD